MKRCIALCVATIEKVPINISDKTDVKPFFKIIRFNVFLSTEMRGIYFFEKPQRIDCFELCINNANSLRTKHSKGKLRQGRQPYGGGGTGDLTNPIPKLLASVCNTLDSNLGGSVFESRLRYRLFSRVFYLETGCNFSAQHPYFTSVLF
jgi:hypothetical protein